MLSVSCCDPGCTEAGDIVTTNRLICTFFTCLMLMLRPPLIFSLPCNHTHMYTHMPHTHAQAHAHKYTRSLKSSSVMIKHIQSEIFSWSAMIIHEVFNFNTSVVITYPVFNFNTSIMITHPVFNFNSCHDRMPSLKSNPNLQFISHDHTQSKL